MEPAPTTPGVCLAVEATYLLFLAGTVRFGFCSGFGFNGLRSDCLTAIEPTCPLLGWTGCLLLLLLNFVSLFRCQQRTGPAWEDASSPFAIRKCDLKQTFVDQLREVSPQKAPSPLSLFISFAFSTRLVRAIAMGLYSTINHARTRAVELSSSTVVAGTKSTPPLTTRVPLTAAACHRGAWCNSRVRCTTRRPST
jgi:hypothetical protein